MENQAVTRIVSPVEVINELIVLVINPQTPNATFIVRRVIGLSVVRKALEPFRAPFGCPTVKA